MTYKLKFLPSALKEWKKLDSSIRQQLKKKLSERLQKPYVQSARIFGYANHYKIKLRATGYRLVYEVIDNELVVLVIAIGKREKGVVYSTLEKRKK
ncbi:MAG TPA: type II toxin-antitoxin system RelE/ParE family toxin [Desulfobacteraceae bacterium]|nr:type II toxin-antitoxin system RelE/ParE family toxin [Desulfobacteraceae bacterium]HPJ67636.1 type II toxin-antitoxin system RelE/ParE family toxin [Desulfobacteraceae bacterium]HPQ29432.1 type II toxin-antitoxin system RelE/ParE family toxin [Desulfobacteraceae bacterium]